MSISWDKIGNKLKKIFTHNWFKNMGWVFSAKIISMVAFLITDMILGRFLGKSDYGEWAFFYSVITFVFYIFWLGINQAARVFVTKEDSIEKRNVIIKSSFLLRVFVSAICAVVLLLSSNLIARILGYPQRHYDLAFLLKAGCLISIGNCFLEYAKQMTMGIQNYKGFFICNIVEFISIMVGVIICLIICNNVRSVGIGYGIAYIIASIIALNIILKGTSKSAVDKKCIADIMKYSMPLALLGIGGMLMVEMDTFMLGLMSTSEQVAVYSIAKSLTTKVAQVNYAITCATIQDFATIDSQNYNEKRKQFRNVSKINIWVTSLITVGFLLFSGIGIDILYGKQYHEAAYTIIALLPYYVCLSLSNFNSNFLDFNGKANSRLVCYIITIVVNFICNFIMIPRFGAYGAAFASGIAMIPYTIILIVMSKKLLNSYEYKRDNILDDKSMQ